MSKRKAAGIGLLPIAAVVREVRRGAADRRPLAVAGARELVPLLARELRAGGDPVAVVEGSAAGAAALVWLGEPDETVLRAAARAKVPIVAVEDTGAPPPPYVLAGDVVRIPRGSGFPLEEIATAVAHRLGDGGTALAARLPALRPAVCRQLVQAASRRNAAIAAAVFIPGVDLPVLTLNQVRLVLRLAAAHGREPDAAAAAELLGVVGAGFGFRALAREALDLVPVAGWAVKGAVAYTGTRAIGEAALRRLAYL